MKNNIRLGMILLLIAALAGLSLGAVHSITAEPIAKAKASAKQNAMNEILKADEFKDSQIELPDNILEVNVGYKGEEIIGYAIKVSPKGYSGAVEIMVGIYTDGTIGGIKILSHSETPGLGANAPKPQFSGQFTNKSTNKELEVVKGSASTENQIEAITGATITSRAVVNGVNDAVEFYNSNLKGE
ncbi:RnfABCDGE type electron transport complex subunit G [Oceanirhabdus sp. W0125-5]|uniref:RnfABCDGE type electron transport complex subunit G n=1 Tax=Oceanirhabdus sp. W0125-5 TaxID=2999116 RepID=UPI0022F2D40A|nr:RnfABCDGE type electron transport complex subunit G [Oceanirhabdus sp. W0125-5]WBW97160.1 RnfABCDGE type electron transport complex subunit G [Oceanirhabdus sp. W0125-5]